MENRPVTTDQKDLTPGGVAPRLKLRMLGTPAPVFPGFEVDILDKVPDDEKPDAVWHRERARDMLKAHPEIKDLTGNTPSTAIWCVLFVGAQITLAVLAASQPWWIGILVAYVVGSWININLFMLAHECNHGLVFKSTGWNRAMFTLTSLPMFMPGHHTWWLEHHVHHSDLGAKKDFIKRRRTFFLLTKYRSPLFFPFAPLMLITQICRAALGLCFYFVGLFVGQWKPSKTTLAILADDHLVSGYNKSGTAFWAVVYPFVNLVFLGTMFGVMGWKSAVYLLASQAFMSGFLHPLMMGMVLSNSHFHGHNRYQPSSSYYGWLNKLTFNFGYHTEHHDLQSIPWSRLPKLRKIAPEFYDCLAETKSYIGLAFQFVFGSRQVFEEQFDNEEHRNAVMISQQEPAA